MFTNLNGNRMDIRAEGIGDKKLVTAHTHTSGLGAVFHPSNCPEMGLREHPSGWRQNNRSVARDIDR